MKYSRLRLNRQASAESALAEIKKTFVDGVNSSYEKIMDDDKYGYSFAVHRQDMLTEVSPQDFAAAAKQIESMDVDQLATFIGLSKRELTKEICTAYSIGADDKDFSGGATVIGDQIIIDLYLLG